MSRVSGKVAIVTGAASGLGYAAAVKLMSEGAKVMLSDINEDVINSMPERLKEFSTSQFSTYVHDVTNEQSWIDLIEKTETAFGQINILVNSAGISLGADVVSTEFEIWKKVHQVNLDSVFLGCKYAIPIMKNYAPGSIVNTSSISGLIAGHNMVSYNTAKAGVWMMSKSVALHCARQGYQIRCNSIHPTFINTPILDGWLSGGRGNKPPLERDELLQKLSMQIPLGVVGDTDDVAYAVLYLASDESKFVTGAELKIDGGISAM